MDDLEQLLSTYFMYKENDIENKNPTDLVMDLYNILILT